MLLCDSYIVKYSCLPKYERCKCERWLCADFNSRWNYTYLYMDIEYNKLVNVYVNNLHCQ